MLIFLFPFSDAFSKFIVTALSPSFAQALEKIAKYFDPTKCLESDQVSLLESLIYSCRSLLLFYVGQHQQAMEWALITLGVIKRHPPGVLSQQPLVLYCVFLIHYVCSVIFVYVCNKLTIFFSRLHALQDCPMLRQRVT